MNSSGKFSLLRSRLTPAPGSLRARFVGGVVWSFAGAVLSRGTTVLASIAAGRLLGVDAFGQLGIVQSTIELLAVVAGLGLGLTATKYVAEHRANAPDAGRIVGVTLILTLASGLCAGALTYFGAPLLARGPLAAPSLEKALRLGALLLPFTTVAATQLGCLAGLEAFRESAIAGTLRGLLSAAGLVAGLWAGGLVEAVAGLAVGEALGVASTQAILYRVCRRHRLTLRWYPTRPLLRTVLRFSVPALLSSLATLPAMWGARVLLLQSPGGYAALGRFSAAQKWSALVLFVPTAVSAIVLPMLSNLGGNGQEGAYRRVFQANLLLTALLTLVPALGVILLAPWFMGQFGDDYRTGSSTLVLLAIATLPMALNNVLGQVVVSSGQVWWRFCFDLLLAAVLFGASAILIPQAGSAGMAGGYAAGYTAALLALIARLYFRPPPALSRRASNAL